MRTTTPLVDDAARDAVAGRLDESTFVEAGAGTGKSTTLVRRILNVIRSGRADITQIAAITFTERAGGELRSDLRTALAEAAAAEPSDARLAAALASVDAATVGTIHSLAQLILRTHALAAGLPLGFTVATGTQATDDKRARARAIIEGWEADLDPQVLATLGWYGLDLTDLRPLVEAIDAAALLVDDAAFAPDAFDLDAHRAAAAEQLDAVMRQARDACHDPSDKLVVALAERIPPLIALLRTGSTAELAAESARVGSSNGLKAFMFGNVGAASKWSRGSPKEWRDRFRALEPAARACLMGPLEVAIRGALAEARATCTAARDARAREGVVDFDGLLSRTRDLLRGDAEVRAHVHRQFRLVLVDEFQDTDPVQWQIIQLITSDPADPAAMPLPGRLVVVGDPKQAIYSFRGANIDTYTEALAQFRDPVRPLGPVQGLTTNFRSVGPLLEWVNAVFGPGMAATPHQVDYVDLDVRHRPSHPAAGPTVIVVRDPAPNGDGDAAATPVKVSSTTLEPRLIAQEIARAVRDQWRITRRDGPERVYDAAAQFSDVAILYPARTGVPALLEALDDAGVPYRSGDARLVFGRPVVAGLLAAIAVVDDPASELDLWAALKSPVFGCADDDLMRHRRAGGRWRITAVEQPGGPVGDAMQVLRAIRHAADAPQPTDVIDALLDHTRLFEALQFTPRGAFEVDCLRMVRAHAQAWQDEGGVGLAEYLRATAEVQSDSSRASLPVPDDRDDNAVRLMTVFQAKGLEFPIVALAGMSHMVYSPAPPIGVVGPHRFEFKLSSTLLSAGYRAWNEEHRVPRDAAERMRVAYVACTRAHDHLIASVCGEYGSITTPHSAVISGFVPRDDTDVTEVDGSALAARGTAHEAASDLEATGVQVGAELPSDWSATLGSIRARSAVAYVAQPSGHGARALGVPVTAGLAADGRVEAAVGVEDGPDASRRAALGLRDGRPLGNAVHSALDTVLGPGGSSDPKHVREACRAAAAAEGLASADDVHDRVTAALGTALLRDALAAPRRWSELYLAAPVEADGTALVEGMADLVFEGADGLVVVDYKTDAAITPETKAHYADQLAAYAVLLTRVTGREVARRQIVHVPGASAAVLDV